MGIYQWKVQAYTPCGGWGPAGTSTFAVVCSSAPEAAQPEDMWVDQHFWETGSMASPRPRFGCENMDDASWCYFDIKRRSGATLVAVGKGWQRVDSWWDEDLGEEFYNATWEAPKDLPAGEYVWSVKKWNPCGYSLTCVVTSTVICVSPDAPTNLWVEVEDADDDDRCRPALAWSVVDNVFTYKMEIQRNGAPFKNLTSLEIWDWDKGARPIWEEVDPDDWRLVGWYWVSPSSMPDGTYRFRVRSYNGGCVPEKQNSSWSDWCTTTVYTVLGPPTTITDPAGVISTVSSTTWEWGCDLAWTPVKNALSYYVDWSLTGLPPCKKRSYVKSWIEEWDYWYDEVDGKNHIWVPFAIPDGLHAMTMKARNCRNQVGAASSVHSFAVMNEW
jgi:hypothetical protein